MSLKVWCQWFDPFKDQKTEEKFIIFKDISSTSNKMSKMLKAFYFTWSKSMKDSVRNAGYIFAHKWGEVWPLLM